MSRYQERSFLFFPKSSTLCLKEDNKVDVTVRFISGLIFPISSLGLKEDNKVDVTVQNVQRIGQL